MTTTTDTLTAAAVRDITACGVVAGFEAVLSEITEYGLAARTQVEAASYVNALLDAFAYFGEHGSWSWRVGQATDAVGRHMRTLPLTERWTPYRTR